MRRLLALLCLVLLGAAAPARVEPHVVTEDNAGWTFGRARAPVLAEYASFGCPHCAHFSAEAGPAIAERVRAGRLRLAFRPFLIFPHDRAAAVLARCVAPTRRHAFIAAVMAAQPDTRAKLAEANNDDAIRQRIYEAELAGPEAHAVVIGLLSGLGALAEAHGVTSTAVGRCLGNKVHHAWVTAADLEARVAGVTGTPTYVLDGERLSRDLTPKQLLARLPR